MLRMTLLMAICTFLCISCSSNESYWNDQTSSFHIPADDIVIEMPREHDWLIAETQSLPDHVIFCGVLPETGVCVFLLSEDASGILSINDYPVSLLDAILQKIYKQNIDGRHVTYGKVQKENCKYGVFDAIKFVTTIDLDGEKVGYDGMLWVSKNKLYGLVAIHSAIMTDEVENIVRDTFSGVKLGAE